MGGTPPKRNLMSTQLSQIPYKHQLSLDKLGWNKISLCLWIRCPCENVSQMTKAKRYDRHKCSIFSLRRKYW